MKTLLIQKRSRAQINLAVIYGGKELHKLLPLSAFCNTKHKTSLVPVLFHVCTTWLRIPIDGNRLQAYERNVQLSQSHVATSNVHEVRIHQARNAL